MFKKLLISGLCATHLPETRPSETRPTSFLPITWFYLYSGAQLFLFFQALWFFPNCLLCFCPSFKLDSLNVSLMLVICSDDHHHCTLPSPVFSPGRYPDAGGGRGTCVGLIYQKDSQVPDPSPFLHKHFHFPLTTLLGLFAVASLPVSATTESLYSIIQRDFAKTHIRLCYFSE